MTVTKCKVTYADNGIWQSDRGDTITIPEGVVMYVCHPLRHHKLPLIILGNAYQSLPIFAVLCLFVHLNKRSKVITLYA